MDSPAPLVSIQLNSNRPRQIALFFDSIEATAAEPSRIEVLLHTDAGDSAMAAAVAVERERRKFTLRVLTTDTVKGYGTLWKPLNALFAMMHPQAYFVLNVSDEFLFLTRHWDSIIAQYVGYWPDHIFRLRASQYRLRNYTDFWECGFAPDSIAFYTRRWLELSGGWCPCLGPDSFQQCVAFYLYTSGAASQQSLCRDIAVRELRFSGEGINIGLEGEARYRRTIINNRAWFVLMSHAMQEEASRRAMRLKSHIVAHMLGDGAGVSEDTGGKYFTVQAGGRSEKMAYGLSWWRITLTNLSRVPCLIYYTGSRTSPLKTFLGSLLLMAASYIPHGARLLTLFGRARGTLAPAKPAAPALSSPPAETQAAAQATAERPPVFSLHFPAPVADLTAVLDSIEATARTPEHIEVVAPAGAKDARGQRRLRLRFVEPGAPLMNALGPQAYFVAFINGDVRFETAAWDAKLLSYIGAFSDHIFRVRASRQRFRNYTSARECVLAPDRITFHTRRWLALQNDAGPVADIAAFQQCVSYYLFTSDPFLHAQHYRETALPFVKFSGETNAEINETVLAESVQQEAKRRALLLKFEILRVAQ